MKLSQRLISLCEEDSKDGLKIITSYNPNNPPEDFVSDEVFKHTNAEYNRHTSIFGSDDHFSATFKAGKDIPDKDLWHPRLKFIGLSSDKKSATKVIKKYFPKATEITVSHEGELKRSYEAKAAEKAVKEAEKLAAKEEKTLKERQKIKNTIIGKAVDPFRIRAEKEAEEAAISTSKLWKDKINAVDGKLSILIPPKQYEIDNHKKRYSGELTYSPEMLAFVLRFSNRKSNSVSDSEYNEVVWSDAKAKAYIKEQVAGAASQFYAYVQKLNNKISDVVEAELTNSDVWYESFLIITKKNGEKEYWKTKQITNRSSLGTPFFQWPTRKVSDLNFTGHIDDELD